MDPRETAMLCGFLQKTTQLDPHRKPGPQVVRLAQSLFDLEAAAILDADLHEVYQSGSWFDDLEEVLQNIYLFETASDDRDTGLVRRVLRIGKLPIGAVLLRGETSTEAADALAALIAITFDRYHAFANESRTERARQTEQMRTTVLDSLAHAYKTPLTAIEAAGGGLAAMGGLTPAQMELVALIEEQTKLLNQITNRLLCTARLEGPDLAPQMEEVAIVPLIEDVVAGLRESLSGFHVAISVFPEGLTVYCDRNLVSSLLEQYVDNAAKYADRDTSILIRGMKEAEAAVLSVQSVGPFIPLADHERIFDRYYRSPQSSGKASGTGIGLSIAKRAAQVHGGSAWVKSDADGITIFYASLPISTKGSDPA